MKQLIINGELAFIDKDQYFPFTYKISDLEEINIINFPSTKSIMLPRNTQNDEIFGHIAEITRSNYGFSDNQSGVSFNQIKKANYELKNNSEIISEGIVRIVNITHNYYEVELYDKAIEILEELEDKEINDLEIINPVTEKPLEERINHETIKDMTVRDWGITPVFVDYDSNFTGDKIYARYNTITGIGEKEIEFPREMTPFQMRTFSAADVPFTMHLTKMMDMIEAKQEVRFSEAVREQLAYVHMLLKKPKNGLSSTEYKLKADHKYLNRAEKEYPVWHNYHVWTDDNQWYIVHNGNHLMKNDFRILFTTNASQVNGNVWSHYKGKTYDDNTQDGTLIGMLNIKSQITLIHNDGAGTEYLKEVNTKVPMFKNRNVSYINAGMWSYLIVKGTFILNNDIYPKDKRGITMRANHSITNVVEKETTYPFDYTFDYNINSEISGTMIHKPLEFTEYDLLTSKKILPNITIKDFIINIAKTFNYNIKVVDGKLLVDIKRYNLANEGLLIDDDVEIDVNKVDFSRLKIISNNASSPLIEEYEEEYETWASKIVNTGYSIKKEEKEVELPYGTPLALTDYNYFAFDQYGAYLNGGYSKYPVGCIKGLEDGLTLGYLGINEETMYVSDAEIIEGNPVISNRRLYRIDKDGLVEWKFDNEIDVPVSILPKYATFLPYRFRDSNIIESLEVNKPHYNFASVRDSQYPEDATLYNRFHKNMLEDKFNSDTHILNAKVFLFGEQDINKVYNYKNSHYIISELVEYDPTEPAMYEVKLMRVNQDLNYTLKPYNPLPEDPNQGIIIIGTKPYDTIQVPKGTEESALPMPSEALAYMSDGSEQIFDVAWDNWENDFNGNLSGEYIRYGNIISEEYSGSVRIVVKVAGPAVIKTVMPLEGLTVEFGTMEKDLDIPMEVDVLMSDGTTLRLPIEWEGWEGIEYDCLTSNEYSYVGTVSNPTSSKEVKLSVNMLENTLGRPFKLTLNSGLTINDSNPVIDISFSSGENEVLVSWGDGSTTRTIDKAVHTYVTDDSISEFSIYGQFGSVNFGKYLPMMIISLDQWGDNEFTDMSYMFKSSNLTNDMVANYTDVPNTSKVISMKSMFSGCRNFNGRVDFDTSNVYDFESMFGGCPEFNQPVNFDTSNAIYMDLMFWGCSNFNYPVNFDTSNVISMGSMFAQCSNFNQPVNLNTSNAVTMEYMFYNCSKFNQPLDFDTSKVTSMKGMFQNCADFNGRVDLDTSNATNFYAMFSNCSKFNQPVNFDTIKAINFDFMFYNCQRFNQPVVFNTSNVLNMDRMFYGCLSFNQPVDFDTTKVTTMRAVFHNCVNFNRKIDFDTSNVTNFYEMFTNCSKFNQPINFDTSKVTNFYGMFQGCWNFNQPVNFDTSNAVYMDSMFSSCREFNQPVNFDTSNVTNFDNMFSGCSKFNQSVNFDTSNAVNMSEMFEGCTEFNQPVNFDTTKVTNFFRMFWACWTFNQPVNFDTANATDFDLMFYGCSRFKQSLASFKLDSALYLMSILEGTDINEPGTTTNYDETLISWGNQIVNSDVTAVFGDAKYSEVGKVGRDKLIAKGWKISDGGMV